MAPRVNDKRTDPARWANDIDESALAPQPGKSQGGH